MQLFRKRQQPMPAFAPRKVDALFVIGNGFDIWQGLDTSYDSFRAYYLANRDEIMRQLHIRPHVVVGSDGSEQSLSDVELVYGDPFAPTELPPSFWGAFEMSLSGIDAQRLNLFFGKDRRGLRSMRKSVRNAKRILRRAFCGWVARIHVPADGGGFEFGDDCLFITFNYTDTLERRFGIDESRVFHIHGEASDADSDGPTSATVAERSEPTTWHFSYHGNASREWYRAIMREFGVENVTCRSAIEECLAEYLVLSGR